MQCDRVDCEDDNALTVSADGMAVIDPRMVIVSLLVAAGLVIGALSGWAIAGSSAESTTSDEYVALETSRQGAMDQLATTAEALVSLRAELETMEAKLTAAQDGRDEWESKYNTVVNRSDVAEVDLQNERESLAKARRQIKHARKELQRSVAAVERREQAVTKSETITAESQFPGEGTFVVGDDMVPGTYRSAAPGSGRCYVAFMSSLGSTADIINDNATSGPSIVLLSDGQIVETSGCDQWVKEG